MNDKYTLHELRSKRNTLWEQAKSFLEEHRDESGLVAAVDLEQYDKMTAEVRALGDEIRSLEDQMLIYDKLAASATMHTEKKMKKFWDFYRNETTGDRTLVLAGPIDAECSWGKEVTPEMFREDLETDEGDLTIWLNSPGGNIFAALDIYRILCDHKGKIIVMISEIAGPTASVIAMAGDKIIISRRAVFAIKDPIMAVMGDIKDMEKAIDTLREVKESMLNAYEKKSALYRDRISQLMEEEFWMNAEVAVDYGFADEEREF